MKIIVCVKHVPDTETRVKIAGDGRSIDTGDVNCELNPYDTFAVEAALALKDQQENTTVTVLCLGREDSSKTIRTALAMGGDNDIRLDADPWGFDTYTVAEQLAGFIRDFAPDMVLFGKQAIDNDSGHIGPMVAEMLGMPSVSSITRLTVSDGVAQVACEVEGGMLELECRLPTVLTTDKGLNEPRYPALKGIMAAKKKEIDVRAITFSDPLIEITEMSLPEVRQERRILGRGVDAVPALLAALKDEVKVI